jgi:hypothetical protein
MDNNAKQIKGEEDDLFKYKEMIKLYYHELSKERERIEKLPNKCLQCNIGCEGVSCGVEGLFLCDKCNRIYVLSHGFLCKRRSQN